MQAHELAIQTGCEVLLKIRDDSNSDANFYYATESLQEEYSGKGLTKQSNETCVSGETGLPIYPRVSTSTQSEQSVSNKESKGQDTPLPLHLTVTDGESSSQDIEEIIEPEIKLEVIDEPENETDNSMELPSMLGDDDMQVTEEGMASFRMQDLQDNSTEYPSQVFSPKLYQCAVCQKAFRSVQVLQKHTQTFHVKQQQVSMLSRSSKGRGPTGRIAAAGRPIAPKR